MSVCKDVNDDDKDNDDDHDDQDEDDNKHVHPFAKYTRQATTLNWEAR